MQSEILQLNEIIQHSGVFSGYSFRGKIKHIPDGEVRVVQLKDISSDYSKIEENCFFINGEKIKSKFFLEKGDILFTSKGTNNYALTYNGIDKKPTIASSAFFVIRVDKTKVNPYFVAWYMNQSPVQNYFKQKETGSYTKSISSKALLETPIKVPTLQKQENISKLADLASKEQEIYTQLKRLTKTYTQHQLLKSI